MHPYVIFHHFPHKAIDRASGGRDDLQYVGAAYFLFQGALNRLNLPWEAAFLAGKAYQRYRHRGGNRTAPMPDFYIGAHAAVTGLTLLTRDARRYREYFPKLKIIAPG